MVTEISRQKGSAFVELVVALPILIVVVVLAGDFARAFYTGIELTNAARAGSLYGGGSPIRSGDISGMEATARESSNITGVTATASRLCGCALVTGTSFGLGTACNSTLQCSGNFRRYLMVKVVTTTTFQTVTRFPGVPNSLPMTRTAFMRVTE